jgi:hypothetical protein
MEPTTFGLTAQCLSQLSCWWPSHTHLPLFPIEISQVYFLPIKVILRPTVSRLVCPGIRPPSGTCDQFLFLFHINYLTTFSVVYYGAPSLTRGRVCNLQTTHSSVRASWNSQPYWLIWHWAPSSLPLTTCWDMMEVC